MTGIDLARRVLEGEDPKEVFRRVTLTDDLSFKRFYQSYLGTMFWSTTLPPYGECPMCGREAPLDYKDPEGYEEPVCSNCSEEQLNNDDAAEKNYDFDDLSDEFRRESMNDCMEFYRQNSEDISAAGNVRGHDAFEAAGHDFWLTRNGHGAGFNDGDWPDELDERLTEAAKGFGNVDVYVGDDGKLYGT